MAELDPHALLVVDRLRNDVIAPLKQRFVGRDEVVDLIALAVVSGEHLFLLGPPGTAKSAVIRGFAERVQGRYFEYLLTRFSEPNELFGPIDLARLREGTVATVTAGMLPEAEFAFLDELFNANSAILNNLLTVLNERRFRRGAEVHRLPLLSLFTASNHLAEDEALNALFDRFLIRCHVDHLPREAMPRLLAAGWELERAEASVAGVSSGDLRGLSRRIFEVDLSGVSGSYADLIWKIRDLGLALSDRRAVKVLKLVAASALLSGRSKATRSDFWVLRYVWDREEQIDPLRSLVGSVLEQAASEDPETARHPLAEPPDRVDGEDLARQLDEVARQLDDAKERPLALLVAARLRDRLAELSDQASWVADDDARHHLIERASVLLNRLG
ncbi:AAA family ATPase [Tautonia marina]|uniref:AAA family ATPase n=1 Tax=Tautonia marina TaxID=2653855 RepID=UPI001F2AED62|nr:AAA family ATPase [Tautonia marina]